MKVTTTPGDCDKVNKIVPIMQEHLGPVRATASKYYHYGC